MSFDKLNEKIAITVPRFRLRESSDGPWGTEHLYRNEPYLVTLAVDEAATRQPEIHFNTAYYPNIMEGDEVLMLGDGHLVYGPSNPGAWVACSVLLMESDEDVREAGRGLDKIVKTASKNAGVKALLSSSPTAAAVGSAVFMVGRLVAQALMKNKDDGLIRTQGTFLRDASVPYNVNRLYRRRSRKAAVDVKVIPLSAENGQGPTTQCVRL